MKHMPYAFLSVAVAQGLLGMGLGVYMGISHDFTLAPAHAHNNLLGWVGMAIFGVYYALVPQVAAQRIVAVHFALALIGNILMPVGIGLLVTGYGEALSIAGTLFVVAGMALFGFIVWTHRSALAQRVGGGLPS